MHRPRGFDLVACLVIGLLLAGHCCLAVHTAWTQSVTHDEYWHLPIGLLCWKTGQFHYDTINPPLTRMWAALPLLGIDVSGMLHVSDQSGFGDQFLKATGERWFGFYFRGRLMNIALSLVCGVVLATWSWQAFGRGSAVLVSLLWSTSPTVLSFASLVTTDLGAALGFAATMFALYQHARRPSWTRATWFGVALGLAQVTKFTSVLLYPLSLPVWLLWHKAATTAPRRFGRLAVAGQWLFALMLSLLVLNAVYLFHGSGLTWGEQEFQSESLKRLQRAGLLQSVPTFLPRDYLAGLDTLRKVTDEEHPVFLDGKWSLRGFPRYYIMCLAYKTPHALQLLAVVACLFWLFPGKEPRRGRELLGLVLPAIMLLLIASGVRMQLGMRYVFPMFPLVMLFCGQTARWVGWGYPVRACCVLGLALAIPTSLRYHPHHLAYFNELSGGPANGYRHLLDANLDWGQGLFFLRDYLRKRGNPEIALAYFGTFPPAALGIRYQVPPRWDRDDPFWQPKPGLYAVSVNFVQGRPHTVRTPQGEVYSVGPDEFGYFRAFTPVASIGYSIHVYEIKDFALAP